jgi:transcriptional regulator with XRE-family HTH domain
MAVVEDAVPFEALSTQHDLAPSHVVAIGERIRSARRDRYTQGELAARAGVSTGLVSQIERGKGNPSLETIVRLATALEIPLADFFEGPTGTPRMLVTKPDRMRLEFPSEGREGLVWELLTPDPYRPLSLMLAHIPSGWSSEAQPFGNRQGEEAVFVLEGELDMSVNGDLYTLRTGDALTFDANLSHWMRNHSSRVALVINAYTNARGES